MHEPDDKVVDGGVLESLEAGREGDGAKKQAKHEEHHGKVAQLGDGLALAHLDPVDGVEHRAHAAEEAAGREHERRSEATTPQEDVMLVGAPVEPRSISSPASPAIG